jgi:putative redox protein
MSLTAKAHRVGEPLQQEIVVNGRHTIVTDEPWQLGGTDTGPTPHELLPAALGGCIGTTIALYGRRREWRLGECVVRVDYDADSDPRRFLITIELPDDLSAEQVERLRRVAETCPVRRALEADFEFEERVVLGRPAPVPEVVETELVPIA